jgi:hypothetical protein
MELQVEACMKEEDEVAVATITQAPSARARTSLKVPKREIFVTELFILSDPIWVGDLRNEPKKTFV